MQLALRSIALGLVLAPAVAGAQAFDLSGTADGFYASPLVLMEGGRTLTISTIDGPTVQKSSTLVPTGMSHGVTGRNFGVGSGFAALRFSFSETVTSASFLFGDPGGDSDSPVFINWFDSSNLLLGSFVGSYERFQTVAGSTGVLSTDGASYFELSTGSSVSSRNSIYWQLTSATFAAATVPEPSSAMLLGIGALALLFVSRRRVAHRG